MRRFPFFAFFLILSALFPTLAFAQAAGTGISMPTDADVTVHYFLNPIFGELVGLGSGSDPMGGVIGRLNAVVLIVGGVLLSYGLVAGTMQTAHDGEVLGKRWSTMWVPIRTAVGTAAIVPLGKGYCAIQYVLMWMVMQGVGAANIVWTTYAGGATTDNLPAMSAMVGTNKGATVGVNVLKQQLCLAVTQGEYNKLSGMSQMLEPTPPSSIATFTNGATNNSARNFCGYITFPPPATVSGDRPPKLQSFFGDAGAVDRFNAQVASIHQAALATLQGKMAPIAAAIYASGDTASSANFQQQISDAINAYNKEIATNIEQFFSETSNTNAVAQNSTQDGWGAAGAWYMKYAFMSQALFDSVQGFPAVTPPVKDWLTGTMQGPVAEYSAMADSIVKTATVKNDLGLDKDLAASNEENESWWDSIKGLAHPWETIKRKFLSYFDISAGVKGYFQNNESVRKNPVLAATDFGHYVFNTAVVGNLAVAGLGAIPAISGWTTGLAPLLFAVFGALIGTGATLAFYLPVMPFILWFGVLIGWAIMVIEAVVAAPLWAVAHIHPDADGIVGRGGQGYSLVLALMLRPALAVIGLVAAMHVVTPVGNLFIDLYWGAFSIGQNGDTGPFIALASVTIFAVIFISILHRIFALIHVIPDQILRWMGGPSGELGQTAHALGERGGHNAAAVGGVVGAMGGHAMQGVNSARQISAARRGADAQEAANFQNAEAGQGKGMGGAEAAAAKKPKLEFGSKDEKRASAQERREQSYNDHWASQGVGGGVDKNGQPQTAFDRREDFANRMAERGHTSLSGPDYDRMQESFKTVNAKHQAGNGPAWNMETYADNIINRKTGGGGNGGGGSGNDEGKF